MKTVAAGLLVVPFLLPLVSSPAAAQANRPWCAQYYGFGGATNCGSTSYQQCMMTAGPGTGAWCARNPMFQGYRYSRTRR